MGPDVHHGVDPRVRRNCWILLSYGVLATDTTNILVHFDRQELLLALANIASMLRPGGCLVHNGLRLEVEEYGLALGLIPVQARTIQLSAGAGKPLFDSFVIQRRN